LLLAVLLAGAAYFYTRDLALAPAHPTPDEVLIALQAESIHATLHDRGGRLLPVYFEMTTYSWFQPMAIYAEAAMRLIAPFNIRTFRLTTVGIALINGVLAWLALRAMLGPWSALAGSLVLLTAPAHFIHGRLAMDYLYPVPFLLGWLWCLMEFERTLNHRWLAAGGALLAAGFFTYASAIALMPAFFALTLVRLALTTGLAPARSFVAAAAVIFLGPAIWLSAHVEMLRDTITRYSPTSSTAGFVDKLGVYAEYYYPGFIGSDAAGPALFSLRGWGLVLPASAIMFAIGVFALWWRDRSRFAFLLAGLIIAGLPVMIIDERHATQRILPLLPFIAVCAAAGFDFLWRWVPSPAPTALKALGALTLTVGLVYAAVILVLQGRVPGLGPPLIVVGGTALIAGILPNAAPLGRVIATMLMASIMSDFGAFVTLYRTDYPITSSSLNGDLPGALRKLAEEAAATNTQAIYLDAYIDMIDEYWQFTTLSAGGRVPGTKTNYRPQDFDAANVPEGSLILVRRDETHAVPTAALHGADRIIEIPERTGLPIYTIYRKR
jgi:hypothetical protein